MYQDSTIPIKANSIYVYITRKVEDRMELLLVNRPGAREDDWTIARTDVKPMELCWQSALNQIRMDTSEVPDRIYSANRVETTYDVVTHAIMVAPIFVAIFDRNLVTRSLDPDAKTSWVDVFQIESLLPLATQRDMVHILYNQFYVGEPAESLKVYPTRF